MHGFLGSQRSNSGSCDARPVTTGCPRAPGVLPPLRQAPVAAPPQEVLEEAQGAAVPDSTGSCDDEEQEEEDAYLGDVGGRVSGKKRLRTSVKGGVLGTVVSGGKNMTGSQIMTTLGAPRSLAYKISKMASKYPSAGKQVYEMPKVRCSKEVLATMAWLVDHMVDFPYKDLLATFQENGRLDVCDSALGNQRVWSAEARKERAHDMWVKNLSYFDGRDGMNTLVAVLHSPLSVSTLVRAVEADATDLVAHILVVRIGGVFLLLLTDKRATKRFPVDWFMRIGDHTSAYLWLNLKEACWDKFAALTRVVEVRRLAEVRRLRRLAQGASAGGQGASAGGQGASAGASAGGHGASAGGQGAGGAKQSGIGSGSGGDSSSVPVILPWNKLSQPTIAGMHLLSIIFSRCEVAPHTFRYVQPEVSGGGSHTGVDVGPSLGAQAILDKAQQQGQRRRKKRKALAAAAPELEEAADPAQWCLEVEAFVTTFAVHKKRRAAPAASAVPGDKAAAVHAPVAAPREGAVGVPAPAPTASPTAAPREGAVGVPAPAPTASPTAAPREGAVGVSAPAPTAAPREGAVGVPAPAPTAAPREGALGVPAPARQATASPSEGVVVVAAPLVPTDDVAAESDDSWLDGLTIQNVAELVRHNPDSTNAMFGLPLDDYADDDDTASDLARRLRPAPRQQRRPDKAEDWCDMDDSVVKGYGVQWGIGEAMGEFGAGSTAVW